jgi:hypothetical protein
MMLKKEILLLLFILCSCSFFDHKSTINSRTPQSLNTGKRPAPNHALCGNDKDPIKYLEKYKNLDHLNFKLYQEVVCKNEHYLFEEAAKKINKMQRERKEHNSGIKRGFHAKGHACVKGKLKVFSPETITENYEYYLEKKNRPLNLKSSGQRKSWKYKGLQEDINYAFTGPIFGQENEFPIIMRYSNGEPSVQKDKASDFRGFGFKVYHQSEGHQRLVDGMDNETQDFLMLSNPRMVAGSASQFFDFVKATSGSFAASSTYAAKEVVMRTSVGKFLRKFFFPNKPKNYPKITARRFWSGSAIGWGERAARYLIFPCTETRNISSRHLKNVEKYAKGKKELKDNYYRADLQRSALSGSNKSVCYDFFVQFQKDKYDHSIEDASKIWSEDEFSDGPSTISTPIHIGKITSSLNSMNTKDELDCSQKNFNPWNGYEFHRPLGSINRIRKKVYQASQNLRKDKPQL